MFALAVARAVFRIQEYLRALTAQIPVVEQCEALYQFLEKKRVGSQGCLMLIHRWIGGSSREKQPASTDLGFPQCESGGQRLQ